MAVMSETKRFRWYELRTTDLGAASAFYADVAGWEPPPKGGAGVFRVDGEPVAGLAPLPERAQARGAPSHWLGSIAVDDVAACLRRFVELGASVLGPPRAAGSTDDALLKDPEGAVLALSSRDRSSRGDAIAWHELHTTDMDRAWSVYAELFGWESTQTLELGPEIGRYAMFTWAGSSGSVGAMANSARLPHIHTHWLFYLRVADLDVALARVRARGGRVVDTATRALDGERMAVCEDPQGAAFALCCAGGSASG
jgi:predicted enzyme related to lactoylglutathione lyase